MNRSVLKWVLFIALLAAAGFLLVRFFIPNEPKVVQASLISDLVVNNTGFTRAEKPVLLQFPPDQGPHENYQTEWWYYTGSLQDEDGQRYGYQLTFFRRGLTPPNEKVTRTSDWATTQVYMAHFAITDVSTSNFRFEERLSRGAAGLAGAAGDPAFEVFLNDWKVEQISETTYSLYASQAGVTIDLILTDIKGIVLQGDQGYSQKGEEAGNASYYISQPRLETSGSITIDGKELEISGESWMDHEWSTSALGSKQVGWDWFAIQLSDGSELMAYTLRREDGSLDPYSGATLIAPDGSTRKFSGTGFSISPTHAWTSPHSGAVYPSSWKVTVGNELELEITPLLPDQELNVSFTYWEGAVTASGKNDGKVVTGQGYVELTGYAHSMQGEF